PFAQESQSASPSQRTAAGLALPVRYDSRYWGTHLFAERSLELLNPGRAGLEPVHLASSSHINQVEPFSGLSSPTRSGSGSCPLVFDGLLLFDHLYGFQNIDDELGLLAVQ